MVFLLSGQRCRQEDEIAGLLATNKSACFPVITLRRPGLLSSRNGAVIALDRSERFLSLRLSSEMVGICEDDNAAALELFYRNGIPVVTCGMNGKNTVSVSSCSQGHTLLTLRRRLRDDRGVAIEPGEFLVHHPDCMLSSLMASAAALLLHGVSPETFEQYSS